MTYQIKHAEGTTFPANPQGGDSFYKTDTKKLYTYDGVADQWQFVGSADTGTAFPTAVDGLLFYHETDEVLYIYSGTAAAWIDVSSAGGFPTAVALQDQTIDTDSPPSAGDPVYFDGTEWLNATGSTDRPTGVVTTNANEVVMSGLVTGLSGLTAGADYYLATAGGLTTTASETNIFIGTALNTTQLVLNIDSDVSGGGGSQPPLMHVREELSDGTSPASSSAGTWNTRALQTTAINQISGASLASNVVTLPAGTYYIEASAEAVVTNDNRLRIRKTSGTAATLLVGPGNRAGSGISYVTPAIIQGQFTLSGTSDIELQHYTESAGTLGETQPDSEVEVYSELLIWQVST